MKQLILAFLIISLIKSLLLFVIILGGDWFPNFNGLLRFLIFFTILWFADNLTITRITKSIKISWIKSSLFLFGTYVLILFITGPLFLLYNKLFDIQPDSDVETPTAGIIGFLIIGLIMSTINSVLTMKKLKRTISKGVDG